MRYYRYSNKISEIVNSFSDEVAVFIQTACECQV